MFIKKSSIILFALLVILSKTFSQVDTTATGIPLSFLKITSVDVKVVNQNVQLLWEISNNEEAKSFEVERADDGASFKKIGGRLPAAQTGGTSYEFVDALPKKNIAFSYRIKIISKDGSFAYSELRVAKLNDEIIRCKLKQNPVRNTIDVEVISADAGNLQVSVFTNYGQKMMAETVRLSAGNNAISLSSQNLLAGLHRLVLETGSERKVIAFVKE